MQRNARRIPSCLPSCLSIDFDLERCLGSEDEEQPAEAPEQAGMQKLHAEDTPGCNEASLVPRQEQEAQQEQRPGGMSPERGPGSQLGTPGTVPSSPSGAWRELVSSGQDELAIMKMNWNSAFLDEGGFHVPDEDEGPEQDGMGEDVAGGSDLMLKYPTALWRSLHEAAKLNALWATLSAGERCEG